MKMSLAIPYGRVNSKGHMITKDAVLNALRHKGYTDANIEINEGMQIIYVFIEVTEVGTNQIVTFKTKDDEYDDHFPSAPL